MLKRLFSPPVLADEIKTRRARYLFVISLGAITILSALVAVRLLYAGSLTVAWRHFDFRSFLVMDLLALLVHVLVRRGAVSVASIIFIFGGWLAMTIQAYFSAGVQDTALTVYIIIFFLAALLLERSWLFYLTLLAIFAVYLLALFESTGLIIPRFPSPYLAATYLSGIFIMAVMLVWQTFSEFDALIKQERRQRADIEAAQRELEALNLQLEKRVTERTEALRSESEHARRRAQQLATIAEIAQTIVRVQNPTQLLTSIVHQISEKLGFYHVGIFLLDERNEFAVLQAASSEGGQKMLQRRHRLPIETTSLVGYTAVTQKPRIALDVGVDAIHFENPDLPDTHSEMTLPLIVGDKTIGVLDIQATEPNAFSQEDIATLITLANQVAIAIENARLFEQTRQALEQAQKFYQQFIQQDWKMLRTSLEAQGYRYDGTELRPLESADQTLPDAYRLPITLRGQTIGLIEVRRKDRQAIHPNEEALVREAAERIAAALDNARLLDELQRRAAREKLISNIGDKIIRTLSLENILEITAEELGALLPDSSISIQIDPLTVEEEDDAPAEAEA